MNILSEWFSNPGLWIIVGIKLAAYFVLFFIMTRTVPNRFFRAGVAALARETLGMWLGILLTEIFKTKGISTPWLALSFIPLRLFEWGLVFKLFYPEESKLRFVRMSLIATGISFVLDLPAILLALGKIGLIC